MGVSVIGDDRHLVRDVLNGLAAVQLVVAVLDASDVRPDAEECFVRKSFEPNLSRLSQGAFELRRDLEGVLGAPLQPVPHEAVVLVFNGTFVAVR